MARVSDPNKDVRMMKQNMDEEKTVTK